MNAIRVISGDATNPALARQIGTCSAQRGAVVGNDLARTRHLAFNLSALCPLPAGWVGFSWTELAWEMNPKSVGKAEYAVLLKAERGSLVHRIRAVRGSIRDLPKTAAILTKRLADGPECLSPTKPARRVLDSVDETLLEMGVTLADDSLQNMGKHQSRLLISPLVSQPNPVQLVMVLSSPLSAGEREAMAAVLQRLAVAPQEQIAQDAVVVIEDESAWVAVQEDIKEIEVAWKQETLAAETATSRLREVRLGHIRWDDDCIDRHLDRIANLARRTVRAGGNAADIAVLTPDAATACYVRTRLVETGVPVGCSEGYLLPMRPAVFDVLSLLGAVHGCGRPWAIARIVHLLPGCPRPGFDSPMAFFEDVPEAKGIAELNEDYAVVAELEQIGVLAKLVSGPCEPAIQHAAQFIREKAERKYSPDTDSFVDMLQRWASRFASAGEMLAEFWRQRALLADWSGYKPRSGLRVGERPRVCKDQIPVLLFAQGTELPPEQLATFGPDLYLAPTSDIPDLGQTASEQCFGLAKNP